MPRPACPKCRERQCSRKKRVGLWQRFILPYFGWFPWECSSCRRIFLVKERGKSKRKKFVPGQSYAPWQPGDPDKPNDEEHFEDDDFDDPHGK